MTTTLSAKQLEELRRTIDKRLAALGGELHEDVERSRSESYGEVAGPVVDSADESVADLLSDLDNAEVARDVREIRALEAARRRIDEGSYGTCADCGADIGLARLRAYPAAERCVACQNVHEKTFVHPGEPRL